MDVIFFTMATVLSIITLFVGAASLVDLIDFRNNGGEFYKICIEMIDKAKRARIFGKILLIPVLIYCGILETINSILALVILLMNACINYIFSKKTTLKKAFQIAFGYDSHEFEDHIEYHFMGYYWRKYLD